MYCSHVKRTGMNKLVSRQGRASLYTKRRGYPTQTKGDIGDREIGIGWRGCLKIQGDWSVCHFGEPYMFCHA